MKQERKIMSQDLTSQEYVTKIQKLLKTYYIGNLGTYTIKSLDGKKVYTKGSLTISSFNINSLTLPKGTYLYKIKSNSNISKTKFKNLPTGFYVTTK